MDAFSSTTHCDDKVASWDYLINGIDGDFSPKDYNQSSEDQELSELKRALFGADISSGQDSPGQDSLTPFEVDDALSLCSSKGDGQLEEEESGLNEDPDVLRARSELEALEAEYRVQMRLVELATASGKGITPTLQMNLTLRQQDIAKKEHEIEAIKYKKMHKPRPQGHSQTVVVHGEEEDPRDEILNWIQDDSGQFSTRSSEGTKKQRQYYRYARDPLGGSLYNPVSFQMRYDLLNLSRMLPNGELREYRGHILASKPDVLKVIITNIGADRSLSMPDHESQNIYSLDRSKVFNVTTELPFLGNRNGLDYYGVPKTPKSAFVVKLPRELQDKPEEEVDIRLHERVFTTMKDPVPDKVKMQVGPIHSIEEFKGNIIAGGYGDIVMTSKDEHMDQLDESSMKQDLINISMLPPHALEVRKYFESQGLIVYDNVYRYQGLSIFFEKKEELAQKASLHVAEKRALGWADLQIAMSTEFPLRTYVVRKLRDEGSTTYTPQFVDRHKKQLYDQGPALNQEQTEQLLDAYYWYKQAPIDQRIDFSGVIEFYAGRGRIARLKNPYQPSGRDVGRSVSREDGQLRFHNAKSMARKSLTTPAHSVLRSKFLTQDLEGNPVSKKIHPRAEKVARAPTNVEEKSSRTGISRFMRPKMNARNRRRNVPVFKGRISRNSVPLISTMLPQPTPVVVDFLSQSLRTETLPKPLTPVDTKKSRKGTRAPSVSAEVGEEFFLPDPDVLLGAVSETTTIEQRHPTIGLDTEGESLESVSVDDDEFVPPHIVQMREAINDSFESERINSQQRKRLWKQTIPCDTHSKKNKSFTL